MSECFAQFARIYEKSDIYYYMLAMYYFCCIYVFIVFL